jgi:hypothetical protein
MRDKRRRLRREREREEERRAREFRASQERIPACTYCGRLPGQVAMPDSARVLMHGPEAGPDLEGTPVLYESGPHKGEPVISRPYAGGWGCKHCIGGLPGEYARRGDIHTIRITRAPTREELGDWRRSSGQDAAEYDPRPSWQITDEADEHRHSH